MNKTNNASIIMDDEHISDDKNATETAGMDMTSYKTLMDLMKDSKKYYGTLQTQIQDRLKNDYHLDKDVLDAILQFTNEQIDGMNANDKKIFLSGYTDYDHLEDLQMKTEEELSDEMKVVKSASMMVFSTKTELEGILQDGSELMNDLAHYESSEKERSIKKVKLKHYKDSLDIIEDPIERKETEKMITAMEESLDFSFMMKRLDAFGDKEIRRINDAFFDDTKGEYVLKRYFKKISKFGFSDKLARYFTNIEENFLPEKYHVFNNLFLFIYMRMAGYADPYNQGDQMMVRSITSAICNLIYHRFATTQEEKDFITIMESVLDRFSKYSDIYEQNNIGHPGHPSRKEKEAELVKERRDSLLTHMETIGMDISEYDESMSIDELNEAYQSHAKELIARQNKELEAMNKKDIPEVSGDIKDLIDDQSTVIEDIHSLINKNKKEDVTDDKEQDVSPERKISEELSEEEISAESAKSISPSSEEDPSPEEGIGRSADRQESGEDSRRGSESNTEESREAFPEDEAEVGKSENGTPAEDEEERVAFDPMDLESEPAVTIYNKYLSRVSEVKELMKDKNVTEARVIPMLDAAYTDYSMEMLQAGYKSRYEKEDLR